MREKFVPVVAVAVLGLLLPGPAAALPGQHGSDEGHLLGTGDWGKIEYVGQLEVTQTEGLVADVAAYGNYAYLANWGEPDCAGPERGGQNTPDAGAWVIDISDPTNPRLVNFIAMPQDTRPGEGMQVTHIETKQFKGEILVMNAEACGKNYKGGFMLYDVTNPLKPVKLKEGFGERTGSDAHQTHSAFVWQPPGSTSAYLVTQDEEDLADVDIYDITNPRSPRLLTELDLNSFNVAQPELNLADSNLHDMTVKCMTSGTYAGKCIMIASYWDGGYVLLDVTNPATPVFLYDTDFRAIDPELFEKTGIVLTPEGNAHQAEFTADNRFFIGTDEDFGPYRARLTTDDGGVYDAGEFGWTVPINELYGTLNGPTVYGGYGCPADRASIPTASTLTLAPGEEAILVLQRGPVGDPSQSGGACFFSEKVETAQLLGYDAVIIANHHTGALSGAGPDTYFCGGQGHLFDVQISALCVGHRAMHELFDDPNAADNFTYPEAVPAVGTVGDRVSVTTQFDGWGYVHLYDAATGQELDTFAIPEAMKPAYASGFGDLTVHEVATDPTDPSLLYLSYYSGGLRALQIQCSNPADNTTCELVEVGGYLDPDGNNFWGVEVIRNPADKPNVQGDEVLILASDRDHGLFIFRDP
ncbi:MAG: PA domain-containing protein [Acidimicrobiales bacterium]